MKKLAHIDSLTEAEWLEYRRGGIGGSDIATIFNLNPWKSPTYLYMEKRGEIEPDDLSDNEAIYWGKQLEDLLRKEFQKKNGWKTQRNNFVLCHDEYDYLRANIDGEIIHPEWGRGVLELKTTSEWNREEWEGDKVPNAYMLQIQYYLAITGHVYAFIVVLIGGNKYRQWKIERDEELIQAILGACHSFWARIQDGNPPPINGSSSTAEALQKYFPIENERDDEVELSHDGEAAQLIMRHEELKQLIEEFKEEKESIANRLKEKVGEYTKGLCHDFMIMWKAPKESFSISAKDLQQVAPDIFEKIKKPKKRSRNFSIKMLKK